MLGAVQLESSSAKGSLRVLVDHTEHKWCPGLRQEESYQQVKGVILILTQP